MVMATKDLTNKEIKMLHKNSQSLMPGTFAWLEQHPTIKVVDDIQWVSLLYLDFQNLKGLKLSGQFPGSWWSSRAELSKHTLPWVDFLKQDFFVIQSSRLQPAMCNDLHYKMSRSSWLGQNIRLSQIVSILTGTFVLWAFWLGLSCCIGSWYSLDRSKKIRKTLQQRYRSHQ